MIAVAWRGTVFLFLWLVIAGVHAADLPATVAAVVAATWASLRLLPRGAGDLSLRGLARLVLRFPGQSLMAGIDVATRALSPHLTLRPDFVAYTPTLRPGIARDAFCAFTSLMPGTVPTDVDADGALLIHCLNADRQTQAGLRAEELMFAQALGRRAEDD